MHVDPLVDDDDRLREAEQAEAPDRVHHLLRLAGEAFADRDDHAVVERARDGQVVVDDLRHAHPDRGQEDPLGRLAEPGVLGRRLADHDRRVDRVRAHRHRRHVEDRELLRMRVVASVVAERALEREVSLLDVALEHDLGVCGHLHAHRLPGNELDRLALEEAGEHELVDVLGQGRRGGVGAHGVEPEGDGDLEPPVRRQVVHAPVLVQLPVHRRRAPVELLHPVHAHVARPRLRVVRDHGRKRDERRGIARPAVLDREQAEIDVVAGEDDFVMSGARDRLRPRVRDRLQLLEAAHLVDEAFRGLHLEHGAQLCGRVVEVVDAEREAHAPLGAELVDQERVRRAGQVLEEERRSARAHGAVDDLRHLEVRVDLRGDADELAFALQERDPLAQVAGSRHEGQSMAARSI